MGGSTVEATERPVNKQEEEEVKEKPQIVEMYWLDAEGNKINQAKTSQKVALYLKVKNVDEGEKVKILLKSNSSEPNVELHGNVNELGEVLLKQ